MNELEQLKMQLEFAHLNTKRVTRIYTDEINRVLDERDELKIERNRYKVALQDIADASGEWAGDKAREVLRKEAQP